MGFRVNRKAVFYITRILIGCSIVWFTLYFLPHDNKIFALISVIVVTDPDPALLRDGVRARILNTLVGCALGLIFIYINASFWSMLAAIAISVAISTFFKKYPANWKLAPVTVVLVMISAISVDVHWKRAMEIAISRTEEILYGSLVAFIIGIAGDYFNKWLHISNYRGDDEAKNH